LEEIIWADRVKTEEVSHTDKEERNALYSIKRRNATWIGHMLCTNCVLKHAMEGKIEVKYQRRGYEKEDVSSHWMSLGNAEDTET
jgi:hypothetical protein